VLASLSIAVMQSEMDAARLGELGMPEERLFTAGNLKFDAEVAGGLTSKTEEIRTRFGLDTTDAPLILAASTHSNEEEILLDAVKQLGNVRLMIAPRHPERFKEVASVIQQSGLSWTRRTNPPDPRDSSATVILLDTIGELPATYELAEIVFVGGSIVDKGGHNVLEPAASGVAVVTGTHTHNFQAIVELMHEAHAIVQLPPLEGCAAADEVAYAFAKLLENAEERAELGRRAKELVIDNQGAANRTIELIAPLLSAKPRANSSSDSILAANAHTS
jgi:3-deoxy-D-manno-octulosonic-acid transferase